MTKLDPWAELRKPFPRETIGILPKPYRADSPKGKCPTCGGYHGMPAAHLDYVGHAAVTDRLLAVDPTWTWEPLALTPEGLPQLDRAGNLWIKLTVNGVTRVGVGDGKSAKELIGDAIRNAAMRFGVALDLWSKEELEGVAEHVARPSDEQPATPQPSTAKRAFERAVEANKGDEDAAKADLTRYATDHGHTVQDAPPSLWQNYLDGVL